MGTSRYINTIDLNSTPRVLVNETPIEYSTSVKYLGVLISNVLSWDRQVTKISNKVHSILYQLRLNKQLFPEALRVKLVTSLVLPHLDYGSIAFTDMTAEHDRKLYRAVNSCIRFIFNVKADAHISLFYARLRWLKIGARRTYFVGCLLYNILNTERPSYLYAEFKNRVFATERLTRAPGGTLVQPQCRTEIYNRSYKITAIKLWNSLPSYIKSANSLEVFKQYLYEHLLRLQV